MAAATSGTGLGASERVGWPEGRGRRGEKVEGVV
jgi:hypothetical protein